MSRIRLPLLCCLVGIALVFGARAAEPGDEETRRLAGLALDRFLAGQARVMRVSDRIRLAGTPFCDKATGPVIGVFSADERTFRDMIPGEPPHKELMIEAARERFALDKRTQILLVVPELAADRAGLQPGDVVLRLDGKKLSRRHRLEVLKKKGEADTLSVGVERDGSAVELKLDVEEGCAYPSRFWFGTEINAFAAKYGKLTGTYVMGGMLHFLPSDDDLAIIMGHELAHLILSHSGETTGRTEADADYLGIYLAARAGYDVSGSIDLEDRFSRHNPYANIDWGFYSHPMGPERSLELRATLAEIEAKIAAGEPLEPERR